MAVALVGLGIRTCNLESLGPGSPLVFARKHLRFLFFQSHACK